MIWNIILTTNILVIIKKNKINYYLILDNKITKLILNYKLIKIVNLLINLLKNAILIAFKLEVINRP